jgi:hypothetical protein
LAVAGVPERAGAGCGETVGAGWATTMRVAERSRKQKRIRVDIQKIV